MRDNNETEHKLYYKQYCKTLTTVIKEVIKLYYKEVIGKLKSKMKTTWNIIRKETRKLNNEGNINSVTINDQAVYNQINIPNKLNSYFSNIAGNINNKNYT